MEVNFYDSNTTTICDIRGIITKDVAMPKSRTVVSTTCWQARQAQHWHPPAGSPNLAQKPQHHVWSADHTVEQGADRGIDGTTQQSRMHSQCVQASHHWMHIKLPTCIRRAPGRRNMVECNRSRKLKLVASRRHQKQEDIFSRIRGGAARAHEVPMPGSVINAQNTTSEGKSWSKNWEEAWYICTCLNTQGWRFLN